MTTYLDTLPEEVVRDIFSTYLGCEHHVAKFPLCACCFEALRVSHLHRRTNLRVIFSWMSGKPFEVANLSTDGLNLYSYELCIGDTDKKGNKIVYDYTAKGVFCSITTSTHVNKAKIYADVCKHPDEIASLGNSSVFETVQF